ncbi:FAD-dependent oxidoreductase [Pseudomonas sp. FW215-R2]|uniref:NAD(P)/FAD-dependent oxidoreductase n=1 Tax=unclassified Pseudomonas TaxID=196821 RepID=UPI000C8857DF|nr:MULTISPECIES: FAD-dependent oxidoreductase [unclassified Pseudomonas]PMW95334.1 FAD-dependent oxidoreductase [Pseudomonas sp. FW215-R2]PMX13153.1 FAD-dependent oxidoreductase [Pseudomonas sp. FW215-L1]PMX24328.1 FAD-dependent oxidoreductase [Pseudomonas sp. FW215-E1]PNA23536.1 FAD-dependent oxidoreductase [Pseudomonas sp. FW215-R4]
MNRFDVLVIGAGPAGCAAAIGCAQRGLRVALIEQQRFPRFRPGESLHPGIEPLLEQLGVAEQLCNHHALRFEGHWVQWNGPLQFIGFGGDDNGPWRGFQISRAKLDAALLQQAAVLGVTVYQPCRAQQVLMRDDRVIGVNTDAGLLFAPYLIDGSGGPGWLSRKRQIAVRHYSPPLVACFGYHEGSLPPDEKAPRLSADPDGWTWLAQVEQQRLHWARLTFEKQKYSPEMIPERLRTLPRSAPIRGADVTWRLCTAPAGPGYFMVGDAASLLDPASSHGVLKALMTGMQAAKTVYDCLRQPAWQGAARQQYSQWVNEWFERDSAQLRNFYSLHPHPPEWLLRDS